MPELSPSNHCGVGVGAAFIREPCHLPWLRRALPAWAEEQPVAIWDTHITSWHRPAPAMSLAAAGGGPGAGAASRAPPACGTDNIPAGIWAPLIPPIPGPACPPCPAAWAGPHFHTILPRGAAEPMGRVVPGRRDIPTAIPASSILPLPQARAPGRAPLPRASSWQTGPAGIFPCPARGMQEPENPAQGARELLVTFVLVAGTIPVWHVQHGAP